MRTNNPKDVRKKLIAHPALKANLKASFKLD